jgi:plasmid replication initiation protein
MNKNTDIYKIVKYDNQINTVNFRKLTPVELNLLFRLFNDLKEKGDRSKTYTFTEIRDLIQDESRLSDKQLIKYLDSITNKFINIPCKIVIPGKLIIKFIPFTRFVIDEEKQCFEAKISEDFQPLLNELFNQYTSFNIDDFLSLKGKYAKHLFRVLKQYRTTGYAEFTIEELRRYLDIPDSMPNYNIKTKVIDVALKELSHYFRNLECIPVKERKKGFPLKGYKFTFEAEPSYVESTFDGQMTIDDF